MKVSSVIAAVSVAVSGVLVMPSANSEDAPTDAEVLKALAEIKVPPGEEAPTVEEFRKARLMDQNGVVRAATLEQFQQVWARAYLPSQLAQKYYPEVFTSLNCPKT